MRKENEILAYTRGHDANYHEAKGKAECLTSKPNTSYATSTTNNTFSAGSISQELAAKDKGNTELKRTEGIKESVYRSE